MSETTGSDDRHGRISELLAAAVRHHRGGDVERAAALCREVLEADPRNGEALHMLGGITAARGDLAGGIDLIGAAIRAFPDSAVYHGSLGTLLRATGDLAGAEQAYRRAVDLQPGLSRARCELGITLGQAGRWREALPHLATALRADPNSAQAHHWLMRAVGATFRDETIPAAADEGEADTAAEPRRVSVIICSIDDSKFERVSRNYAALLAAIPHEIIRIPDARSLCEGYNRGIAQSRGDVLIFSHDDIEILNADFGLRLLAHLARYDLVGVVGTSLVCGPAWTAGGWPHGHGKIIHRDRATRALEASLYRVAGAVAEGIQAFDGLFFAANRYVTEKVRFDADTFDGFHHYDLDFTYAAFLAGFRLAVCNDLDIIHDSRGPGSESFRHYSMRFALKYQDRLPRVQAQPWPIPSQRLENEEDARAFGRALLHAVTAAGSR